MFKEHRLAFDNLNKSPETKNNTPQPQVETGNSLLDTAREGITTASEAERISAQAEIVPPKPSEVALVGDSIGTGIERALNEMDQERGQKLGNRKMLAVGGVRTDAGKDTISSQIDQVDSTKFPYLIIQGGTNDIGYSAQNPDPRDVARKLADLYHKAAKKQPPFKKVMLITIPPHKDNKELDWETRVKICNEELRKIASAEGINLFDLYEECMERTEKTGDEKYEIPEDGVHPGKREYKMIANMLLSGLTGSQYDPAEALKKAEEINQENPSKAVHTKYLQVTEEIKEDKAKLDEEAIRKTTVVDLRKKSRVLNPKPEQAENPVDQIRNLKDETARRIRAYTSTRDNEWYTLNYMKFGKDAKGVSHEMNIGLGDILLDNDIQDVLIMKTTGEIVKAHKQLVTNGRHKGRVAYTDAQGRYIPTYTGDKFRILSDKETDLSENADQSAIKQYVEKLAEYDKAREENEPEIDDHNYASGEESMPFADETDLDPNQSVVEQILKRLDGTQLENAKIIEREFKAAGLTNPNLIAAAIVNAHHESGLRNIPSSVPGEDSAGLFQLYIHGRGEGMTLEERLDPVKNVARMIRDIKGKSGARLLSRAEAGASVQELAHIFCYDMEIPANRLASSRKRARSSLTFFRTKPLEKTESLIATYKTIDKLSAHINIQPNQETWFVGSSAVNGLASANRDPAIGTIGIVGASPHTVLRELEMTVLPRINPKSMPKRIVLVGMCVNGLSTTRSIDKTVEENLKAYKQIAELFEKNGVQVKISPAQLYGQKKAQIIAFNKALKENPEYSKYYLETGIDSPDTQLASDNLHLTTGGYKKILDAEKALRDPAA